MRGHPEPARERRAERPAASQPTVATTGTTTASCTTGPRRHSRELDRLVRSASSSAPQMPYDDDRPADDEADPEPARSLRLVGTRWRAQRTTTRVTHFVWRTPGRLGPMRRTGKP